MNRHGLHHWEGLILAGSGASELHLMRLVVMLPIIVRYSLHRMDC
jgi:hypothetical protein